MFHYHVPFFQLTGTVPERVGNSAEAMAPAECFCTRDGIWLMIAAGTDGLFKKLALAFALPELTE